MASQRDHQEHLKKVALEGFALIDEHFGRSTITQVYTVTNYPGILSQHQRYGGRKISEGGHQAFVAKESTSVVSSSELALLNSTGGTSTVIDYRKNKPLRWAYY